MDIVYPSIFICTLSNVPLRLRLETACTMKPSQQPADLILRAFDRMKLKMFRHNFVPDKFHPRRARFEPSPTHSALRIEEIIVMEESDVPTSISQEAYAIEISNDGKTVINVVSPLAALRAFDTLCQVFYAHSSSPNNVYTSYAPLVVKDAPVYEHRGLHLDISRNWIPPQDVLRTIEAMELNKLNRLHLHASDSQSWPLEIPALPELAREGAYREDQVWTVKDLTEVQRHGLYRGVEVYIEIDMPSHTGSIVHAYPDLIAAYNERPWDKYAQEPPSGQLRLNSPDVCAFLQTLFDDLLPRLSVFNSRFHLGGDELNLEAYALDPGVRSSSKEVIRPFLQTFFDHAVGLVKAREMTPYMWQDMLLEWDLQFPPETIFQAWRPGALKAIVAKGHRALFGACEDWYLDCGFGTFIDPSDSNDSPIKRPYADWCAPYKNWRQIQSYDPLADIPEELQHLVIGGEVHLWGELTDGICLDFMLWPRVAAAAEMMWRGKGEVGEATTRRLAEMRERLVKLGVRTRMVQMEWGLRNQGGCVL